MEQQGNMFKYSVPFTMVANELIMCETMSPTLKTIYSIACCYASSQDASCYPSYTTLARKAGVCRSTAIRAIKELVDAGLLCKETKQNAKQEFTSNTYVVSPWNAKAAQYFHCPPPAKLKEKEEQPAEEASAPETAKDTEADEAAASDCAAQENTAPQSAPEGSVSSTPPPSTEDTLGSVGDTPPFLMNKNQGNNNHCLNNNQSIHQDNYMQNGRAASHAASPEDELMDEAQLHEILARCELEQFTPDVQVIFQTAIERLYYSEQLHVGNAVLPKAKIRAYLHLLDCETLESVLTIMTKNQDKIKNTTAWLMSTLINEICFGNSETILAVPPECQNIGDFYA